jgi:predicted small lipoprotein YifL
MTRNRAVLLLLSVALAACKTNDPLPLPPPEIQPVARQVSGVFVDAGTGALVTSAIDVSILGATGLPSPYAQDLTGVAKNRYTTRTGVLSFRVADAAPLPLDLVVVSRANGFAAGSARVRVAANGHATFTTLLADLDAPPEGVETVVAAVGTVDATGLIAAPIALQTPAGADGGTAQLSVPAGTVITTATGAPLTGALRASVAYFAPSADAALAAFPGGLDVVVPSPTGAPLRVAFLSAGFAAVELTDAAGRVAANFSQPFSLTVNVPEGTMNPETGLPVAAGDAIPFWSYDEATGRWNDEGDVTLGAPAGGVLPGVAQVDHLSYFNLDWYYGSCALARPIGIVGNPNAVGLTLTVRAPAGGYYRQLFVAGADLSPVYLYNAPTFPLDVVASVNGQEVGRLDAASLCGTGALTLPVTLPAIQPAWLAANVVRACETDEVQRSAVGGAPVVIAPRMTIERTRSEGTAFFPGLTAGEQLTVSAFMPDGVGLGSRTVTLQPGFNSLEFLYRVRCEPGGITGVTGSSGWN